jgi:hypothetical protein
LAQVCYGIWLLACSIFNLRFKDALVNLAAEKVGCIPCKEARNADFVSWMAFTSWPNHLKTAAHLKAVETRQMNEILAQQAQQQYHALYTSHSVPLQHASVTMAPRPAFDVALGEDVNGIAAGDFEFDPMQQESLFPVHLVNMVSSDNQAELLRREIELLHLEALDEEFEGADDETVPRMADEFRELGTDGLHPLQFLLMSEHAGLEPEEGNKDDVYEGFAGVPVTHNYAPYGNKTVGFGVKLLVLTLNW